MAGRSPTATTWDANDSVQKLLIIESTSPDVAGRAGPPWMTDSLSGAKRGNSTFHAWLYEWTKKQLACSKAGALRVAKSELTRAKWRSTFLSVPMSKDPSGQL